MAPKYVERCIDGVRKTEHVRVAEAALRRELTRGECVHHVDEDTHNDAPENLVICSLAYHNLLHKRMRAFAACGNPNAHRCQTCGGYDNQADIHIRQNGARVVTHHRECLRKTERARPSRRRVEA